MMIVATPLTASQLCSDVSFMLVRLKYGIVQTASYNITRYLILTVKLEYMWIITVPSTANSSRLLGHSFSAR